MASRFRNEMTVTPPVRIKVGRLGLMTTIDWRTESAGQQSFGLRTNLGAVGDHRLSGPLPTDRYLIAGTKTEFGGGDLAAMTSPGLSEFKMLLLATCEREREIRSDIFKAKCQLALSWTGNILAWLTLAPAISKTLRARVSNALVQRRTEVSTLKGNLTASRLSVSFDMETEVAEPHRRMLNAFDQIAASQRSWVYKMTQRIDRVKARSAAGTVVERNAANLGRRADKLVDTQDPPMALAIQNGKATAYFYPGFILVVGVENSEFATIDLSDLTISYSSIHFTETESVPSDAVIVGKVWAKSNKNGTRDKRFKDNRELPVMLYGEIELRGPGGLNEVFMFSRNDGCKEFVLAVNELKSILTSTPHRIKTGARISNGSDSH